MGTLLVVGLFVYAVSVIFGDNGQGNESEPPPLPPAYPPTEDKPDHELALNSLFQDDRD